MRRLLSRTSISIDEAISILLGRSTGPIELEPVDDTAEADANRPSFSLRDTLEDELDVLEGEYDLAKYENAPARVIAEKLAALETHVAVMEQADAYRCAIDDEFAKGERSVLRLDPALTSTACKFVTLHSFNEWRNWVETECPAGQQPGAEVPVYSRTKMIQQEDAILAEIIKQGFDPKSFPRNPSGKSDVKASVREALMKSPLFKAKTAFRKAWERLREEPARIVYSAGPSSPKKIDGGD